MIAVSKTAPAWPKGRDIHAECGPHQLRAVLASHGIEKEVEHLYSSDLHRRNDWTLPVDAWWLLRKHGVRSRLSFRTKRGLIPYLINSLQRDCPVVFVIRSIQGTGCLHWISVWGYEPARDAFLAYDSQCESAHAGHGNVEYDAETLRKSLPWKGTFALSIGN